jgi:hypothetical protein
VFFKGISISSTFATYSNLADTTLPVKVRAGEDFGIR